MSPPRTVGNEGRQPRFFVEAFEREIAEAGLFSIRRYRDPHRSSAFDAVLVAADIDAPARVVPVDERGTVAIVDTLFIHS